MDIIKVKNYEEMSRVAADIIAETIKAHPTGVLGLATGSTPIGTYQNLVKMYRDGKLDFSGLRTVNLDEYRGLPRENDQSYYYFMHKNLFDSVNLKKDASNLPDGSNPDADAECVRYEKLVESLGYADLQLLGIGRNGHIGFNEPADVFEVNTHCVKLTQSTIDANKRFFASEADVPREAYTMGIGTIMKARKVLILASGKDKAWAVKNSFFGPVTPNVPASILQFHQDVVVVADEDAMSEV
ncbi:MAG: glucosamine-6-phosphate deaminase [Lachnospiraceae bacterium]|nr:glucosamine-6-phosphate deaminase [Lachnospiraceae bacterium]